MELNRLLFIDSMNLSYANAFVTRGNPDERVRWIKWRIRMLSTIINIICKYTPSRLVIAMDDVSNWRKGIYSEYKNTSMRERSHADIQKEVLAEKVSEFFSEFKDAFTNVIVMKVPNCEADDVIASITLHSLDECDDIIILSGDNDFCQLHKYNKITQYTVTTDHKKVTVPNPELYLDVKVITGDKGDNIPPIKRGIGRKTAQFIVSKGVDLFLKNNSGSVMEKNYWFNKTLIDFDSIPAELSKDIISRYSSYPIEELSDKCLFDFFGNCNSSSTFNIFNSMRQIFTAMG